MKPLERGARSDWGHVFLPKPGFLPPAVTVARNERVLHVALCTPFEQQPALQRALSSLGTCVRFDWQEREAALGHDGLQAALIELCSTWKPTLVFMQLQRAGVLEPFTVDRMRAAAEAPCVIVNWDGDQHHEPDDAARRWFVDLGAVCDTSLVVNTAHPDEYAALGVRRPGYLQIGIDQTIYQRTGRRLPQSVPRLIYLASNYPSIKAYDHRRRMVDQITEILGEKFCVYGGGWQDRLPKNSRPMLTQPEEAMAYNACQMTISSSIRADLPRYTSDRLLRALACGADVLVERFPDMEGLGLEPGANCLAFDSGADLFRQLEAIAVEPYRPDPKALARGGAAYELGQTYHSWDARMPELMAIVSSLRDA